MAETTIKAYSRNYTQQACPRCGHQVYRDKQPQRTLHDLGNLDAWCPRDLVVTYAQHYCTKCRKYFNAALSALVPSGSRYTHRVIDLAVRIVVEDGLPYRRRVGTCGETTALLCPLRQSSIGLRLGGKKAQARMDTDFLDLPWLSSRGMWPSMNCMMDPSAFSPRSIIAATNASSMTSWTTIPPTMTSGPFWGG